MTNSSDDFLNIIGLEENTRELAKLKVLIENPSGEPNKEILLNIFEFIKKIYGTEKCTILWWDRDIQSNPSTKIISVEDIKFLHNLWERIAGNYLLFLPVQFDANKFNQKDEEEYIGLSLITYSHLILKSPDGYEVMYLTLNK
ncbi:hypothetical protein BGM26_18270 [Bacillus sp. FJAT-29790]|uniref:hypothetical protein n=1 Tax=Bacillus sp. FJAT-29790 TaxID=1895002 RepID=UPI001C23C31B|nr:hypothetical protein [Bacillus sp. FJAT-29790]MBU8880899.1 hypothetical protein [Bacillus sp. FJAT-29790]